MTGAEFLRRLRKLGQVNGVKVEVLKKRGKGSHETVYYGQNKATLPDEKKEVRTGTLHAICKQLGIQVRDLK